MGVTRRPPGREGGTGAHEVGGRFLRPMVTVAASRPGRYVTQFPELRDRQLLWRLYVADGQTAEQIATQLGCSPDSIYKALIEHDIPRRARGGAWGRRSEETCKRISQARRAYLERRELELVRAVAAITFVASWCEAIEEARQAREERMRWEAEHRIAPQHYPLDSDGVCESLREALTASKRRGEVFDAAWTQAVSQALRGASKASRQGWRPAFTTTRPEWRRAYLNEGEPLVWAGMFQNFAGFED